MQCKRVNRWSDLCIKFRGKWEVSELADDWYLELTRAIFRFNI
ncbi:MAG: hypothetical protein ACTSRH_09625 [Promethearchaeota archaeon]